MPQQCPIDSWFWSADRYEFHKARIGIRHACDVLGLRPEDEVLAPAYYCGTEIDPLVKAGLKVTLYKIDSLCKIGVDDLREHITSATKAIYVTHFFGFPQDVDTVRMICNDYKLYLLEDCALALFSQAGGKKLGTTGDIAVFSLTKFLPVPDGGVLLVNNKSLKKLNIQWRPPDTLSILRKLLPFIKSGLLKYMSEHPLLRPFYRILFSLLNNSRIRAEENKPSNTMLSPIRADMYYDNQRMNARSMSPWTKRMLSAFKENEVREARRRNYLLLLELLKDKKLFTILFPELPEGVCPMAFPILVDNRDAIRLAMYRRGIDAGAFWKGYHDAFPLKEFPDARYLKDHLLIMPIHQEFEENQVRYVAQTLLDVLKGN